ncbi:Alpha/Beta hydrolase protein [Pilobolus umbonatus]|nr:Alpha/Beta hydrolase protein [Pilobolus umbonatus]
MKCNAYTFYAHFLFMKYGSLSCLLFLLSTVMADMTMEAGSERWPIIYKNEDPVDTPSPKINSLIDLLSRVFIKDSNDELFTPPASTVIEYANHSDLIQDFIFYSALCKTTNCRKSVDKWDCAQCKQILPDGRVVRSFITYPFDVTGQVVVSASKQAIYFQVRGASSVQNKLVATLRRMMPHPTIDGAHVAMGALAHFLDIKDIIYHTVNEQLTLHPDYKVIGIGHSFGASVCSLLIVDLYQRIHALNPHNLAGYLLGKSRVGDYHYAKFFEESKIPIYRLVNQLDDSPHKPSLLDGYVHEGNEYWQMSGDDYSVRLCPGPYETRNCSNSLRTLTNVDHLNYFGTFQGCEIG